MSENENLTIEMIFSGGKYSNAQEFSIAMEKRAIETKDRYLDVILEYCEDNDIDPEMISKSLTPSLKEKIQAECESLNLLTTKSVGLPE